MKKLISSLFGERAALVYLAVFAAAIGIATFVENDYGTATAQAVIYQTKWFEALLLFFAGALIYNALNRRLWQRGQYAVLLFHWSIVVILIGSGITRYFGFEGMMHLREGMQSNEFISRESYVGVRTVKDGNSYIAYSPVQLTSIGSVKFDQKYTSPNGALKVKCIESIPNPTPELKEDGGHGVAMLVFGGTSGREERALAPGDVLFQQNLSLSWSDSPQLLSNVQFRQNDGQLYVRFDSPTVVRVMATGQQDTLEIGQWTLAVLRALYSNARGQFVIASYEPHGKVEWVAGNKRLESDNHMALHMEITNEMGQKQALWIQGQSGREGRPVQTQLGDVQVEINLGSKLRILPFELELLDFEMTRYPGTSAPATFASEVRIIDPGKGTPWEYNIHMNHILDYKGYRFFQSSYDQDEQGSYLSVNHDFWGTWITYVGYFLLTLGMIWAMFAKGTRFSQLLDRVKRAPVAVILLGMLWLPFQARSQSHLPTEVVDEAHASHMSAIYVQDFRGRIKPMHTLSREVLRKISGRDEIEGWSADQFLLSALMRPEQWYHVPMIKQGRSPVVQKLLGTTDSRISYAQAFDSDGSYLLAEQIAIAQAKKPTEKDANDKALIALDERINIMNMVFSGTLLKWVPVEGDPNHSWAGPNMHGHAGAHSELATEFFAQYFGALQHALQDGHYSQASTYLDQLAQFQQKIDGSLLPSDKQRTMEFWLNDFQPFNKLAQWYLLLAMVFVAFMFIDVFIERPWVSKVKPFLFYLALGLFALHTASLGLRWYVSERAPWSNGYESMIYIGWTSALAGLLFSKKEWGAMAATQLLAGTVLLIAMLSYLNPEITPLVPVLKSYWLTIHVSLEAGSYGFLMLGAIIGLLNLLLMVFMPSSGKKRVLGKMKRLTAISELTMTGGLYMLSVGTYLGGVWANESWGRYWGWDAKETWALVSILVYAFILHMRFIPRLNSLYAFNVASLFGLSSVIMTYFGVNYYLSGLHSYASGDPIPIPSWVYIASVSFVVVSILAYFRWRRSGLQGAKN